MIKAVVFLNAGKEITGFRISGHAGYGEYGEDIVCSAVSVLALNTVNSIAAETEMQTEVTEKDGYLEFFLPEFGNEACRQKAGILMRSFYLGLQGINENYSDYITLSEEVYER